MGRKYSFYALPLVKADVSTLTKTYRSFMDQVPKGIGQLHITNSSNSPVFLSFDGSDDHDLFLPMSSVVISLPRYWSSQSPPGSIDHAGFWMRTDPEDNPANSEKGYFYIASYCLDLGT